MDEALATYFDAWNEQDPELRRGLLERPLAPEVELLDPTGRWEGVDGIVERIGRYHDSAPDTRVIPASEVDSHNDVVRYSWSIVDPDGSELLEGLDVAERSADGRLRRIFMFHGPLP